jgi:hypothetical protein
MINPVAPSIIVGDVVDESMASKNSLEKNKDLQIQGVPEENSCFGSTCDITNTANGNADGAEGNEDQSGQDEQVTLADIQSVFEQGSDILVGETDDVNYTTVKYGNTLFVTDSRCNGTDSNCRNYVKIQSRMPKLYQLHVPLSAELHLFRRPITE